MASRRSIPDAAPAGKNETGAGDSAGRLRTGRPTKESAEALSRRLVDIAGAMFLEQGFAHVSLNAIAARARVAKHTIYRRFVDKSALFSEVVRSCAEVAYPPPDIATGAGMDPLRALRAVGRSVALTSVDPNWVAIYRMTVAEANRFPALLPILLRHTSGRVGAQAAALIAQAQRKGSMRPGNPEFIAQNFLYAMGGRLLHMALAGVAPAGGSAGLEDFIEDTWQLFMTGAGIPARA